MTLSETWFMEGYIDFELQKYKLLAYLKEVRSSFRENKLYPQLADIVAHYNNLVKFRENKHQVQSGFPRKVDGIDWGNLEIKYEQLLSDDGLMCELEAITDYAAGKLKCTIDEGAELYELIEKQMIVEPVGIMPLYKNEGYMFLRFSGNPDVRIYNYTVTIFEHKNARYKGLRITYIDNRTKTLANTYEQIKLDLIRDLRDLPNPAVYKIEFPMAAPLNETLLPVAKRLLVRHIA